jgi:hypothetical protein
MQLLPGQYIDPAFPGLVMLSREAHPLVLDATAREQLRQRGYVVLDAIPAGWQPPAPGPVGPLAGPPETVA